MTVWDTLLRVLAAIAGGAAAAAASGYALRRLGAARAGTLSGRLGEALALPVATLVFVAVAWGALAAVVRIAHGHGVAFLLLVAAIGLTVDRLLSEAVQWHLRSLARRTGDTALHSSLAPLVRQLLRGLLVFIAVVVVLGRFQVNVSAFLTTAGVASLAIALAAQDSLANLFAGIVILFDRPFRVGDRVSMASAVGDVVEIGLRSTRIRGFDNNLIIIPNKDAVAAQIINRSYPTPTMALTINVGVGYDTDIADAKRRMLAVATAHPDILATPAPAVYFTAFGDSSLNLQMWAFVADYRKLFATEDALNEGVLTAFREGGIEIPFPQRVVTFAGGAGPSQGGAPGSAD